MQRDSTTKTYYQPSTTCVSLLMVFCHLRFLCQIFAANCHLDITLRNIAVLLDLHFLYAAAVEIFSHEVC